MKQKLKIRKVGNSSGIILPKELLEKFGLEPGSELELQIESESFFIIRPPTLDELLSSMPDGEMFTEMDSGPDVGLEK